MPKNQKYTSGDLLLTTYAALTNALFGIGKTLPDEIVARVPAELIELSPSRRIELLWQLVQFLDLCIEHSLAENDDEQVILPFARARNRAQLFLQREIDAVPEALRPDFQDSEDPEKPFRLH